MKVSKNSLVPILFAIGGVAFLVPTVKSVVTGQPLNLAHVILTIAFFIFSFIFVARKSSNASGPPAA